jgi:chemotaxis signal transduction protein
VADGAQASFVAPLDTIDGAAIVFAIADGRYALPLASVEAIMAPPVLCRVPHAPDALLGAGNLGGQMLPVVDLASFFPGSRARRYDGGGEVLRVSAAGGAVGFWVDRVERFAPSGITIGDAVTVIDPDPLVRLGMTAPNLAAEPTHPLGDAGELVIRIASRDLANTYFLVEAAGERCQLARDAVLEFIEPPPSTPVPGAPAGLLGIGIVRGEPLPMVSLAVSLGLPERGRPSSFALVRLDAGGRFLLGLDRIVGLRARQRRTGRRWVDQTADIIAGSGEAGRELDLAGTLSEEVRAIIAAFAPAAAAARDEATASGAPYLVFIVASETYALPVDAIERVVPAQKPIALPHRPGAGAIAHAIELRGQLIPVLRLEGSGEMAEPGAYVVMRGATGMTAIGVRRVDRLIILRPDQITPAPGEQPIFDGVAVLDEAHDLLRILAADRLVQVD